MSPLGAIDSQYLMAESQVLRGQHRVRTGIHTAHGNKKEDLRFPGRNNTKVPFCLL